MRYVLLALALSGLSIFLNTATPVYAQSRGDDRPEGVREVRETVRRVDRERNREALDWVAARRIPHRIRQQNGKAVQIINVVNQRPVYYTSFNQVAADVTHTRSLYPGQRLGLSLTGKNMNIGIWDAGHVLDSHQELNGRVTLRDTSEPDDHATHVGGTLVATGIRPEAMGMAYEAGLLSYDWTNDASEMNDEATEGLLVSNHSYGPIAGWYRGDLEENGDQWYWLGDPDISREEDYTFGLYTTEAAQYDRTTYANPYLLPVVAAGNDRGEGGPSTGEFRVLDRNGKWTTTNTSLFQFPRDGGTDGFDSISGSALAKNVLTVGSIGLDESGHPRTSYFSSYGPADDGRIKPDLVGYGERVMSAVFTGPKDNMNYGAFSGTSMSTPNVSGSLLLLQQYYHDIVRAYMRAATLKALAIHTATDIGTPGPDYKYGWGLLNTEAAAGQITSFIQNPAAILEHELENSRSFAHSLVVSEPGPLRVTLSWTDRSGSAVRPALDTPDPQLRNDLDVRLFNETTGEEFFPFILDRTNPNAPAKAGDNVVDPVEQIFIADAQPGNYTLVVSHKGSLVSGAPQPFSLIVSGASDALQIVSVAKIDASPSVDEVVLQWQTLFERENGSFQIERTPVSVNLKNEKEFGTPAIIGSIEATGSPDNPHDYEFHDEDVLAGRYIYRLLYDTGRGSRVTSEIDVIVPAPEEFAAISNYPNPITDHTVVVVDLPETRNVKVEIFDALGRRVASILDQDLAAGRHELEVDARGWAPGIYFARVTTRAGVITHKMIVAR